MRNTVYDRLGKTQMTGQNLRPVLRYARVSPVNVIAVKPGDGAGHYDVTFYYDNGAECRTCWADWRVLLDWLHSRRSWGANRLTFDTKIPGVDLTDRRFARIRAAGTVVTTHDYK